MTIAWYLDAIDARAGRAFATWRPGNLFEAETLDDGDATYFIGPPDFEAEPVGSRAVAQAAARHGFQEGLLDEQGEIPFPDLESVTEFVRRVYVRGGGGDGGGGAGEGRPDERGPPPPDLPPFDGEDGDGDDRPDPAARFAKFLIAFQAISAKLARGDVESVRQNYAAPTLAGEASAVARLARGALRIALDYVRDAGGAGATGPAAGRAGTMAALGRAIRAAGLARPISKILGSSSALDHWLATRIGPYIHGPARDALVPLLLAAGDFESPHLRFWPNEWSLFQLDDVWEKSDPVGLLFRLRAPEPFQAQFAAGACKPGQVSVGHLLFSVLGFPQRAIACSGADESLYEILLFAAACIVGPAMDAELAPSENAHRQLTRAPSVAFRAEGWLRNNIALKAFAPDVEALIDQSAALATARATEPSRAR